MASFHVIALLVSLAALFSYLNHRYLHLHPSIGVMLIALLVSLALIAGSALGGGTLGGELRTAASAFLGRIRFDEALMNWMLAFLLFAGGLSVDVQELARQRWLTALLATVGTLLSAAIVAALIYPLLKMIGIPLSFHACLLLGALISPTDPVAVLAMVKRTAMPKSALTIIAAESLFNDGVGVVLFLTLLHISGAEKGGHGAVVGGIIQLARQSLGGIGLGLITGAIVYMLIRRVREYQLEVLLTLALAMGAYSLADVLGVSGPIAVVIAGLLIGNRGGATRLDEQVNLDMERFWELLEELLNAVLFVLIGLEILVTPYTLMHLLAAACAIPVVLLARWVSVQAVVAPMSRQSRPSGAALVPILTWGGLRGGLPIAMALIIPPGPARDPIVAMTYGVVAFSILVQGTTLRPLVARWTKVPTS